MAITEIEPKAGYICAHAGLKLIDSAVAAVFDDPSTGYLDISTELGR